MRQPSNVLSPATKNVLWAIFDAMDRETGTATRYHDTLAGMVGMTAEGVRKCIRNAREAGFLISEGRGGISRFGAGVASTFRLTLPIETGMAVPVLEKNRDGCTGEAGLAVPKNRDGCTDNPLIFPSSISSEEILYEDRVGAIRAGAREEWSVVDLKTMAAWAPHLPNEDALLPPSPREYAEVTIGNHAMRLLGCAASAPKVRGRYLDAVIREELAAAGVMDRLKSKLVRGKLSALELATEIAALGYFPMRQENSNAA